MFRLLLYWKVDLILFLKVINLFHLDCYSVILFVKRKGRRIERILLFIRAWMSPWSVDSGRTDCAQIWHFSRKNLPPPSSSAPTPSCSLLLVACQLQLVKNILPLQSFAFTSTKPLFVREGEDITSILSERSALKLQIRCFFLVVGKWDLPF